MAQTYAQFKAYVLKYVWRDNDADMSASLDVLIQQANDELEHKTRDWQRRQKTVRIQPEVEDFNLTTGVTDFQAVLSVSGNTRARSSTLVQVLPSEIYLQRASSDAYRAIFASERDDGVRYLRLAGPFSATDPGDFQLRYRIGIPAYASADASWLEDEYLNLYLYTVLKHCAMFLREDERLSLYGSLAAEAFTVAEEDDKHNLQFGGSPLYVRPHRVVP